MVWASASCPLICHTPLLDMRFETQCTQFFCRYIRAQKSNETVSANNQRIFKKRHWDIWYVIFVLTTICSLRARQMHDEYNMYIVLTTLVPCKRGRCMMNTTHVHCFDHACSLRARQMHDEYNMYIVLTTLVPCEQGRCMTNTTCTLF